MNIYKKLLIGVFTLCFLTACSQNSQTTTDAQNIHPNSNSKILIVYFASGENSEVDVASSASVTKSNGKDVGIVHALADKIHNEVKGDMFSIQTSVKYPQNNDDVVDYAKKEQDAQTRPTLTSHMNHLEDYDIIFIGYPNWWYDLPMVMYSFFDEYDFSGKTVIPFCTHRGSGFSDTIKTIQELEPKAHVITDGFTISADHVDEADKDVKTWIRNLGF